MSQVKIEYFGHSCFRITGDKGCVVLDPYEKGSVPGTEMPENSSSLKSTVTHPHDCSPGPCSGKDNSRKSDYPVSVLPHLHRRCP